jgi:hypothetical protein
VFVVSWEHEMDDKTRAQVQQLRRARIIDAAGDAITNTGMLAFGIEQGGVGFLVDVTRPNVA